MTNGNGLGGAGGPRGAMLDGYGQTQPPGFGSPHEDGLSLRGYLTVLWRRKWVILLVIAIATASAYYFAQRSPKQYATSATMIYEGPSQWSSSLLGGSYSSAYERDIVMNAVNDLLQSPELVKRTQAALNKKGYEQERSSVTAAPRAPSRAGSLSSDSVVTVTAIGTDPDLAAATANAAASSFIAWSDERVQTEIRTSIGVVKERMAKFKSDAKMTTDYLLLEQRRNELEILVSTTTGGFRVIHPAVVPSIPFAPDPQRSALLGLVVGIVAALSLAFLLELFDVRVRQPEEIGQALRQPILGRLPRISGKLLEESPLIIMKHPGGPIAEAFRKVRTSLEFMTVDNDVRSLLVTSSMISEGKSVCVANLAISMALAGKKVVVVDADMRRPSQHRLFAVDNAEGLSTVATGRTKLIDALVSIDVTPTQDQEAVGGEAATDFTAWAHGAYALTRLYLLPSGPIPPNPGEIVSSRRFAELIATLKEEADLVVMDTPAMLAVGDTPAMASAADGVLFLVDLKRAKKPQLREAAEQLYRLPSRLLGVVVRMDSAQDGSYYSSYHSYSEASTGNKGKAGARKPRAGGRRSA